MMEYSYLIHRVLEKCVSSRRNKCNDWQGGMMAPEASFFVGKEQGGQEEMHNSEG